MTHFNILDTRLAFSDAYTLIQSLCQQIESKNSIYTIQTKLKNDMSIGQGTIEFQDANSIVIYFGLGDKMDAIYANNDPNDTISIQDFVYLITTIFHEKQHLQQEIDFLTKNDAQTLNLAIEKTFSFYNFEYYKKYEHVFLYEIDAERQAYLDAHKYLTQRYGKHNADKLMHQCILRRQNALPILTKECHNYTECLQNINQIFNNMLNQEDKFDLSKFSSEDCMYHLIKDKRFQLNHSFREIQNRWEQMAFCCIYGMQKDKSLNLLPDTHILKQQPWINNIDKLPTRNYLLQCAKEEAQLFQKVAKDESVLFDVPDEKQSAALIAVADGMDIKEAILCFDTNSNRSVDILNYLNISLSKEEKVNLYNRDFHNFKHENQKNHIKNKNVNRFNNPNLII